MNPSIPHCPVTDKKNCPAARPTWPLAALGSKSFSPGRIFYPGLKLVVSALAASLFMLPAVQAADATWTNNAASTWATAANWDPNAAPGATSGTASADTATFYTTALTASRVVTVDTGRNIKNILFTNSTATFTLQLTGGSLLLSSGGKIELQSSAIANIQTYINSPITLEGGYTFLNNGGNAAPTANPLEFQGSAAISGAASLGTITLTLGGTNGTLGAKGLLSGIIGNGTGNTLGIVKQDSGIWQLNGVNTFTGGVQIKQGAILIGNNAGLGNNTIPVILGDNATGQDAMLDLGSSITAANPITVASGSGARLFTYNGGSGNSTYSGPISLTNNVIFRNISGTSGRTITFNNTISGTGGITVSNSGATSANTAIISGLMNSVGGFTNVSSLGDVTVSGIIGTNVTAVVQNTPFSFLNLNNAANTYVGSTIINAGTLNLGATASISSSTNITVASGATFNVSAVSAYTLASGQTLQGLGSINGNVATANGSIISPAGSGVAGTLTFNNNFNTTAGGSFNLDVSTSSGSGNDVVSISGTLTSGGTIKLSALSGAANLDTTADYVLITAGGISGSFASTPAWIGTAPANSANFSIVTSGSQVLLHFNPSVPPNVVAAVNPSSDNRGQAAKITATVTPGSAAISTVTVDLSSIGGSSTTSLVLSNNNIYTNTFTVGTGSTLGSDPLTVTVTDANSLQGFYAAPFSVLAALETWNGGGTDNNWGTGANWTNGVSPLTGDYVFFNGSTRTSPNLETGYSVAGLSFNNGAASFNIGTDSGSTLTLTGGITNNSPNTETLTAPLSLNGTDLLPIITAIGNVTLAGTISDGGLGLIKSGSSNLILSAANNYSGPTVITNGTLTIGGSGTLGGGSANLTVASATSTLNLGGSSQTVGVMTAAAGSITNGTITATDFELQGGTVSANLAGSGIIATKSTTNTLVLTGNNTFDGGFVILNTSAGLCINSPTALGTGTLNVGNNNGGSFDCTSLTPITNANNNAITISGNFTFVGSQNLNLGTGPVNMGSIAKTITVSSNMLEIGGGIFNTSGSSTLTVNGSGTLILSGASTYTGATAVGGGTLLVNGSLASTSAVTVSSGASLGGNGSVSGPVIVNAGGTLSPGTTSIGALTVNSNLTLSGNVFVKINKTLLATNDSVIVTGALTNAGTGTLTLTNLNLAHPLAAGDSFKLFSQAMSGGSSLILSPVTPGIGLAWTNKLAVDGTVGIVTGVAMNRTNILLSISSGNLTLSWPVDHTGWTLQMQTNSLNVGLSTNWFTVPGSSATNQVVFPINPATGTAFFRLVSP